MAEQVNAFENDPLDPEIAKIADRVIDLTAEVKVAKEKLEVQQHNLYGLMLKASKRVIHHRGKTITASKTESKEKIVVKEQKAKKARTGRRGKGRK